MIKILKSDINSVVLSTESLNIYPLPAGMADSLSSDEIPVSRDLQEPSGNDATDDSQGGIALLSLLVAQRCNLRCSYCFAKAYMGSPSQNRVMSPAVASVAVERVLENTPAAHSIQFFGGEPLLGFATIKEAVRAAQVYCRVHHKELPAFTITTNGILIDRKVVEFFKRHNFSVTISLDGPRHVNDEQRRFPSGKGTFDRVKSKIDLLRGAGVEMSIEAVFTESHRAHKETIESTYEFLTALGARDIHLASAIGGQPREPVDEDLLARVERTYGASTQRIMDSWLTDSPMNMPSWSDILHTLLSRKGKTGMCGAGYDKITVDCSGKVFPCHMLMSDSLSMGNVLDAGFPGEAFRRVASLMRRTSKDSFPKCLKCWAKKLCSPCYGDTFHEYGNLSPPRERTCIIIRSIVKAIVLKVAEFMSSEEKWEKFRQSLNREKRRASTSTSLAPGNRHSLQKTVKKKEVQNASV